MSVQQQKEVVNIKADRKRVQMLFSVSLVVRKTDIEILRYELSRVPLSLAKTGGQMHSTVNSDLLNILSKDVNTPSGVPPLPQRKACILLDGHALFQSMGKPLNCLTFGEYARVFLHAVEKRFKGSVERIHVILDRYGIWLQADITEMFLIPPIQTRGWTENSTNLEIQYTTTSLVPVACTELVSCGCERKWDVVL